MPEQSDVRGQMHAETSDDRTAPYWDAKRPIEERVADLLARMTREEKIGQMLQVDARSGLADHIQKRHAGSILHASAELIAEAATLVNASRLQIPLLVADDCIHGHSFWPGATIFPTQLAMAASWDTELVERVARATAVEVAATGIHWTFSPVLCISRDLRWGRIDETFGEDPLLIGELGAAMIRGYQGEGLSDPTAILATAKHFAGYSETQGGRDASEADISPRKLRSWFLPPFERAVQEGCRTFMLGYQSMDGVPITLNHWLLNDVLRGEWGFDGTLVTDWDNVGRMVWEQQIFEGIVDASAAAVRAGNDLIMSTPDFFEGAVESVRRGLVEEHEIDAAAARMLTLKFQLGLFEDPRRPDLERQRTHIGSAGHAKLNLDIAREGVTLLRTDGVLPLLDDSGAAGREEADDRPFTVAVIGPNSDDTRSQLGDWAGDSGQVDWMPNGHPRELIETVLDGFRAVVPDEWRVLSARGADIGDFGPDPEGERFPDGQPRPAVLLPAAPDERLIQEAVDAARAADVVVAVVGDNVELTGEGRSTATLELLGGQIALLDALAASGTPLVVVVLSSKPLVLPRSAREASALIQAFNPGMRGGRAIAEVILGLIEPSGRLPITMARHVGQQPVYYNQIRGQHGNRYADFTQDPLYAFGEGYGYSEVEYGQPILAENKVTASDTLRVTVELSNVGHRTAHEVVQVYVRDVVTSVTWASKELKAFQKVEVPAGEKRDVSLSLPVDDCTIVTADGRRVVERGRFELLVGRSSRDEHLQPVAFEVV